MAHSTYVLSPRHAGHRAYRAVLLGCTPLLAARLLFLLLRLFLVLVLLLLPVRIAAGSFLAVAPTLPAAGAEPVATLGLAAGFLVLVLVLVHVVLVLGRRATVAALLLLLLLLLALLLPQLLTLALDEALVVKEGILISAQACAHTSPAKNTLGAPSARM